MDDNSMMNDIKIEYEPEFAAPEFIFDAINPPISLAKNIAMWSNDETNQMLDLYSNFINEVGPSKKFKRKKDMWMEISSQIGNKSFKQCEERFKTLLKRKKKGIERVYISEAKTKNLELEDAGEDGFEIISKPKIDSDSDDCTTSFKEVQVWSNSETKLLMDLYKNLICKVGPKKQFVHKKDMWDAISKNFQNKDPKQCEQRYKNALKKKKRNVTAVYITKARRKTIDFRARRRAECALQMNRVPELEKEDYTKPNTSSNTDNKDVFSISETLLRIAAKKEEGKERRHKEKMEAMEKLLNTLQQILNRKK